MSRITVDSKCFKTPADVLIYETEKQRVENQVPSSTVAHNTAAALQCSRRKKITVQNDHMLDKKNTVRERLRKKLQERKQKK